MYSSSSSSLDAQENTTSFPQPFYLHICPNLGCHLLPQAWGFHASLSQTSVDTEAAFHALPSSPDILRRRAAISQPCVLWLSKMCATCIGFESLKTVLMSKLARYIVGLSTVPCLIKGFLSSCNSQCFGSKLVTITFKCWQLIPSTPPTCRFFHWAPSPGAEWYRMHTTLTSPMSTLLLCSFWSLSSGQRLVSSKRPVSRSSTNMEIPSSPWIVPENTSQQCGSFPWATFWSSRSWSRLRVCLLCCRSVWPWVTTPSPLWFRYCVRPL